MTTQVTTVINQITVIQDQIGDLNDLLVNQPPAASGGIGVASVSGSRPSATGAPATVVEAINMNTEQIETNAAAIYLNELSIANQGERLDAFEQRLESINGTVSTYNRRLDDMEKGMAAVASMPDLFLNTNENFAATASLGAYGSEVGFGTAVMVRGNDYWTFGLAAGHSGGKSTGKLQARVGW